MLCFISAALAVDAVDADTIKAVANKLIALSLSIMISVIVIEYLIA